MTPATTSAGLINNVYADGRTSTLPAGLIYDPTWTEFWALTSPEVRRLISNTESPEIYPGRLRLRFEFWRSVSAPTSKLHFAVSSRQARRLDGLPVSQYFHGRHTERERGGKSEVSGVPCGCRSYRSFSLCSRRPRVVRRASPSSGCLVAIIRQSGEHGKALAQALAWPALKQQ